MWNQQQPYYGHVPQQPQPSGLWTDHNEQRFEDAEEEDSPDEEEYAAAAFPPPHPYSSFPPPEHNDSDNNGDDDDDDEAVHVHAVPVVASSAGTSRGKPEAMAAALAAAHIDQTRNELQATASDDDFDDDDDDDAMVVAEPILEATPVKEEDVIASPVVMSSSTKPPPKKKARKSTPNGGSAKKSPSKVKSKKSPAVAAAAIKVEGAAALPSSPCVDDPADPITPAEHENMKQLMEQFCKVPLLAEFSRPVTLLHPELSAAYLKIVPHPIDLGMVCRKLGRREYKCTRDFQLDMWRIFSNCVRYHSHPSNKEAVPSFVSIALHLRDFFNALWQEYLMPSDPPALHTSPRRGTMAYYKREQFATRDEDRKKRLIVSGLTCLSVNCLRKTATAIDELLNKRGLMDNLDKEPLFMEDESSTTHEEDDRRDLQQVADNLKWLRNRLFQETSQTAPEYTVDQFSKDFTASYTADVFENNAALRIRVGNRLQRFLGKILVPVHEANCRGVTQSSIWGCMAAAIWARESSKKPYWPALVLGILAPDDQKEDWHWALTERNELRLPEKLRIQLTAGKRKAEQALKRQSLGQAEPQSFFLVEFLGTHEFIWVRETDIVETFEPDDDPNVNAQNKKKNRYARNSNAQVVTQKNYQAAVEEAKWALEEFEMQLQDACGDFGEDDDTEAEDSNYSYGVLCLSDDEAEEVVKGKEKVLTVDDIDEANELIATRGLLDFSVNGRKNAKKRAQVLKRQRAEAEKKQKLDKAKRAKAAEQNKKKKPAVSKVKVIEREEKKELKELERRRKKRAREREKALKQQQLHSKKNKRRRTGPDEEQLKAKKGKLGVDKRARATAIVNAYLTRMASNEDFTSLGLGGVLTLPAAQVDSSGLLGMALAFRSAAGELSMPDESGDQENNPWDAIDVDSSATPEERIKKLEQQVELLQNEIKRCQSSKDHREELAEEADRQRHAIEDQTLKDELKARESFFKKKKKSVGTGVASRTPGISPDKSEQGAPSASHDGYHDVDDDVHMAGGDKSNLDDDDDSHEGDADKPEFNQSPQITWERKKDSIVESTAASEVDPSEGPDDMEE